MTRILKFSALILLTILVTGVAHPVPAVGQGGTPSPTASVFPLICSATDYTTIAATALGIKAAEVRLAIAKGQTLQDIATSKNVDFQKVVDAIMAARNADIQQAVKDGLLTDAQATMMMTPGTALGGSADNPTINITTGAGSYPYGVADHNLVNPFLVVAKTLSVSCPELYAEVQSGKSVVRITINKKAQIGAVINDLLKAYMDALAQDVTDGLITQAQADERLVPMTESILTMVSNPDGMLTGGPGGRIVPVLPPIPNGGNKSPKLTPTPGT